MLWPKLARALFAKPLTDNAPLVPRETIQALGERLAATSRARLGRSLAIRVRCDRFISEYAVKPAMARRQEFQGFCSAICRMWGQRAYM